MRVCPHHLSSFDYLSWIRVGWNGWGDNGFPRWQFLDISSDWWHLYSRCINSTFLKIVPKWSQGSQSIVEFSFMCIVSRRAEWFHLKRNVRQKERYKLIDDDLPFEIWLQNKKFVLLCRFNGRQRNRIPHIIFLIILLEAASFSEKDVLHFLSFQLTIQSYCVTSIRVYGSKETLLYSKVFLPHPWNRIFCSFHRFCFSSIAFWQNSKYNCTYGKW